MGDADLLLLQIPAYAPRISDFLRRIDKEPALIELFARNPVGTLQSVAFPREQALPPESLSKQNRLLFALLSNRGFNAWAKRYQSDFEERAKKAYPSLDPDQAYIALAAQTSRGELYTAIADAALSFIDRETLYLFIESKSETIPPGTGFVEGRIGPNLPPVVLFLLLLVLGIYVVIPFNGLASDGIIVNQGFSRTELRRVCGALMHGLQAQADQIRSDGKLVPSTT